ncbi:hypothetical protein Franean1_5035 [Parafrankia sp. EAN1pec]|uniref:neuraminidase-like domain-containing protein n=1 Tax=Parafrankia sp. (strain EAN1pec) TaxID=298653 RepID=UPI0000540DE0|nr:hypothetical protein Franean1_5035 [Frankia sp. EAN1pec]
MSARLVAVAPPLLARWREARQRRLWAAADHPAPPGATTPLVIDPDLLVAADLRNRVAGDPAFDLWTARRQWVDATFAAVRASRAALGGAAPADVFDRVVADVVGAPLSELTELDQRRRRASSIDAELDALHLLPAELARLVRLREMAATGIVTDDEWRELDHLLTQVRKRQRRADWLAAEAAIALTPEHFVLSTGPWSPVAWRASAVERADWLDRLQARMDQESAVREALRTAVSEVEQAALPRCRDGLISLLGTTGPAEEADRLTELLLVDFSGGGTELTTRVDQAIETVQLLFLGLRSGRLPSAHPALAWTIEPGGAASLDEEWAWMGGYDSWRAALFLFTYPQDLLAPSVRDTSAAVPETARPTPPFRTLVTALRGQQRPRRDIVLTAANEFLATIRPTLVNFPIRPLPYTAGDEGLRDGLLAFGYTDRPTAADLARIRDLSARVLITLAVGHPGLPNYLQELFYYVPLLVAQNLQRGGDYVAALDWYRTIYAFDQTDLPDFFVPSDERKIYYGLQQEGNAPDALSRGIHWLRDEVNPHALAGQWSNPYTRYTFTSIARCFLEYGDFEFTRDTGESRARARSLYLTARSLLRAPELANLAGPGLGVAVPSPVLTALLTRVDNQLRKLRQGRNIAGLRRPVEPPDAAASTSAGMPYIGAGGQLVIPALNPPRPTPYHFTVLLERARQLAATAAQVEASYLSALEKRDAEAYGRLTAGLDLDVARAGEALQSLRVSEAQKGTELARRQKAASDVRATTFQQWIDDGPNEWERSLVRDYDEARVYRDWMVGLDAAITAAQAVASVSSIPGAAAASTVGGLAVGRAVNATSLNRTEQDIALNTLRASQERRQDEWELQLATATQDGLVAQEAILLALDHEAIVGQEARIAGLQAFEAQSVTDFLTRKFTSAELYEWMSGVLGNTSSSRPPARRC